MSATMQAAPAEWSPKDWRDKPIRQAPEYPDPDALVPWRHRLRRRPPLIFAGEARA